MYIPIEPHENNNARNLLVCMYCVHALHECMLCSARTWTLRGVTYKKQFAFRIGSSRMWCRKFARVMVIDRVNVHNRKEYGLEGGAIKNMKKGGLGGGAPPPRYSYVALSCGLFYSCYTTWRSVDYHRNPNWARAQTDPPGGGVIIYIYIYNIYIHIYIFF